MEGDIFLKAYFHSSLAVWICCTIKCILGRKTYRYHKQYIETEANSQSVLSYHILKHNNNLAKN